MKPRSTEAWAICYKGKTIRKNSVFASENLCWLRFARTRRQWGERTDETIDQLKKRGYTCIPVTIMPREVEE